jgi:hypothetical protein
VGLLNLVARKFKLNREERVLASLTLDHLSSEEKRGIINDRRDYQDILPKGR